MERMQNENPQERLEHGLNVTALIASRLLVVAGVLAGLGILGYQVFTWLKTGAWPVMSLWHGLHYLFPDWDEMWQWFSTPRSWVGLHKLVSWLLIKTPLSLVAVLLGLFFGFVVHGVFAFLKGLIPSTRKD
jgi:hypothetical protein